jgi:hypothetical protein
VSEAPALDARAKQAVEGLPSDHPTLQARHREREAARHDAQAPSAVPGLQARVESVSSGSDTFGLEARLQLRNPFEVDADREARAANEEVAVSNLELDALELRVGLCERSTARAGQAQRRVAFERLREDTERLVGWARERSEARLDDELGAQRFRLDASTSLARRRPVGLEEEGPSDPSFVLPSLTERVAPLDTRAEVLEQRLAEGNPEGKWRQARGRALEAQAKRSQRERLPWFNWVGVEHGDARGLDPDELEVNIAVGVPFGLDLAHEAERDGALAERERLLGEGTLREAQEELRGLLDELQAREARADEWAALSREADEGEALARRWLQQRQGDPEKIHALLLRVYEARAALVDARVEVGELGCEVLRLTGTPLHAWPRRVRAFP